MGTGTAVDAFSGVYDAFNWNEFYRVLRQELGDAIPPVDTPNLWVAKQYLALPFIHA